MEHVVYFSLGANIGEKEAAIAKAIERIGALIGEVMRQSTLYRTLPWGFVSDNTFVNAAVCCRTTHSPQQVLRLTQQIERELGRTSKSENGQYHDRTIDIDILLYDDIKVDEPGLRIPHPHMYERDFVMRPLAEILPDGQSGFSGTSISGHRKSG